jgi:hypothetical protein
MILGFCGKKVMGKNGFWVFPGKDGGFQFKEMLVRTRYP